MATDPSFDSASRSWTTSGGAFLPGPWRWLPLALVLVLSGVGWWTFTTVERSLKQDLREELETLLRADVTALELWIDEQFKSARMLASQQVVQDAAGELVVLAAGESAADRLRESDTAARLAALLTEQSEGIGYAGFALLDANGTTLVCQAGELVGSDAIESHCNMLPRVREGQTFVSRPVLSPLPLPDADGVLRTGLPMMFVATPVTHQGETVGALALRLRPDETFTRILQVARSGATGETYAFDDEGLMISGSRFDEQLKTIGLIPDEPGTGASLHLHIRDPGVDLTRGETPDRPRRQQPLTRMAAAAIDGETGSDVDGYRDYRGVPVVGAWTWIDAQGFGVATELDVTEAYAPLIILRTAFVVLFGLLVLAAAAIVFSSRLVFVLRRRMRGAMKEAERMGQYTLEEKIGEGGMGAVYLAKHVLLRRPTALKLLHPEKNTAKDLARFEREVQLTSRLTHPNTIAIYDYGHTPEGVFYYAMEYLEGTTLRDLVLRTGPLCEARTIYLLRQICASLAEAHGAGLIHRDIKPANVMVCARGGIYDLVKVLDFGLVKDVSSADSVDVTAVGAIAGTPNYLAPEAVRSGGVVDARTDIYAIGVTGYYLLTGTELFKGASAAELLAQHLSSVPERPSERLGRPLSDDLQDVILACLAKDPDDRPQTAEEIIARLSACRDAVHWSRDDARCWWESDGQACPVGKRVDAGSGGVLHSMFIDVGTRTSALASTESLD